MVQKYKKRMRLYHGAPSFFILNLYFLLDKNSIPVSYTHLTLPTIA